MFEILIFIWLVKQSLPALFHTIFYNSRWDRVEASPDNEIVVELDVQNFVASQPISILSLYDVPQEFDPIKLWLVGRILYEKDVSVLAELSNNRRCMDCGVVPEDGDLLMAVHSHETL